MTEETKLIPEHSQELLNIVMLENNFCSMSSIDLETGARLMGNNKNLAKQMIMELVKTLPKEILAIEECRNLNDIEKLQSIIHRFYGGLCYCGVPKLFILTKQLNDRLKTAKDIKNDFFLHQIIIEIENIIELSEKL